MLHGGASHFIVDILPFSALNHHRAGGNLSLTLYRIAVIAKYQHMTTRHV